jgi:hypothetical protein
LLLVAVAVDLVGTLVLAVVVLVATEQVLFLCQAGLVTRLQLARVAQRQ